MNTQNSKGLDAAMRGDGVTDEGKMLTVADLADEIQFTPDTIRYAIASGELSAFKFGSHYRIRRQDADSWIESHRVTGEVTRKAVPLRRGQADPYALGKVAS